MEGDLPIQIVVYDKDYNRKGYVMAPLSVTILLAWNVPGQTVFELDASHGRVNDLVTPGARCVVRYRPEGAAAWMTVMTGMVSAASGKGGPENATREFTVLDDLNALNEMISYPDPDEVLSDQSPASSYVNTGPLETVFKQMVSANITGQGIPKLSVQASAGLGDTVTIRHRMKNIGEHMLDAGIRRGLGWRIRQSGTSRVLQAWEPATHPRVLTEESGIVHSAEFTIAPPEVTRCVVGIGSKNDNARSYVGPPTAGFADTAAEALWGIRRQEYIDAQDIPTDAGNPTQEARERAQERLLEGKAKASLKAELAETASFRFGVAFNLGDTVSIKPSGAAVITDRVREVEITWDTDGLQVVPRVGEWTDTVANAQWKAIRKALRRVNDLGTV